MRPSVDGEKPPGRARRTAQPSVTFANGRAVGWAFRVGECFKAALDIRFTPRSNRLVWTEGLPPLYAFEAGDLIHHGEEPGFSAQVGGVLLNGDLSVTVWRGGGQKTLLMTQRQFAHDLKTGGFTPMPSEKLTRILLAKSPFSPEEIAAMSEGAGWQWVLQQARQRGPSQVEICFTGFRDDEKAELAKRAKDAGMHVVKSVTANLLFLCCGQYPGPRKLLHAKAQGVRLMAREDFFNYLETGEMPPPAGPEKD